MGRDAGSASALATGDVVGARYRIEQQLGRGATACVLPRVRRAQRQAPRAQAARARRRRFGVARPRSSSASTTRCASSRTRASSRSTTTASTTTAPSTRWSCSTAQDLRERGQLPWRDACALLRDIASSLAVLHSRRLLHRDVSARNVRCTSDGRAKLIDFGAMMAMGLPKQTVGTPPFVPPEALQLQALDARADLYALGALGYHMLTGQLRVSGTHARAAARRMAQESAARARAGARRARNARAPGDAAHAPRSHGAAVERGRGDGAAVRHRRVAAAGALRGHARVFGHAASWSGAKRSSTTCARSCARHARAAAAAC